MAIICHNCTWLLKNAPVNPTENMLFDLLKNEVPAVAKRIYKMGAPSVNYFWNLGFFIISFNVNQSSLYQQGFKQIHIYIYIYDIYIYNIYIYMTYIYIYIIYILSMIIWLTADHLIITYTWRKKKQVLQCTNSKIPFEKLKIKSVSCF